MLLEEFADTIWRPHCRRLRHTDIKTTARYYLKPDMSVLRDAQRSFERLIVG